VRSVTRIRHLSRRAVASFRERQPGADDLDAARRVLSDAEWRLFSAMTPTDQTHSLEVARRVRETWPGGGTPQRDALAAALLHDVGKIDAGLGTAGRIVATLAGPLVPDRMAPRLGRIGRHLAYPATGRELLMEAGSDETVAAWAAEHHLPEERWTVPVAWGRVLQAADDAAS
jgi:hypothetical protein